MAAKPSLYGFIAEGETYHSCAIVFTTAPIEPGTVYSLGDLQEPTNAGYQRIRADTLEDLFPDPIIVPDQMAQLVSRPFSLNNLGTTPVALTGVALVVWKDAFTPIVIAIVPSAGTWNQGRNIGGKLRITSKIYDEEN